MDPVTFVGVVLVVMHPFKKGVTWALLIPLIPREVVLIFIEDVVVIVEDDFLFYCNH